jgi:sugar (pentulose or hexulose) kinase
VRENIKPEKERIKHYRDQKERYRKIVDRIGEIYRDFGKE